MRADKPNVVIFYTDDQGTLDANCFGSTDLYTPTIGRLAAAGAKFTQAYAHTANHSSPGHRRTVTGNRISYPSLTGILPTRRALKYKSLRLSKLHRALLFPKQSGDSK